MKKILFFIKENKLNIEYKLNKIIKDNNLINTNIISNNELVFSDTYIKENKKLISSFLLELCQEYNICKLIVKELELVPLILELIKNIKEITYLNILTEKTITYVVSEAILNNDNIKYISVYNIPSYLIEMFDLNNKYIESRSEILFTSNFMELNNLSKYSLIYYKMTLKINVPLNNDDLEDLETFCQINKYLKSIHINKFDKNTLEILTETLYNNRIKHIKIYIHDNIDNIDNAIYLKEQNKIIKKKYNICYKLVYSDEYIEDNLFKQTMINVLKTSAFLMIFLIIITVSFILISNTTATKRVSEINTKVLDIIDNKETIIETIPIKEEEKNIIVNTSILALKALNEDTVGYLKVKGTNIDYPIVKYRDNNYYLKHNYNKEEDNNGWVFMNYQNDDKDLDRNTIFYAHNRYYSGIMFGTLNKVLYKSWYSNKDNLVISFDTMYESNKYQVFSVYKIKKTVDYLLTDFKTNNDFLEFANKLKNRSIYDFNIDINEEDEIITLSTCKDMTNRIVLHAVRIKK